MKTTLLQLNTSIFSADGQSSRLADSFVAFHSSLKIPEVPCSIKSIT